MRSRSLVTMIALVLIAPHARAEDEAAGRALFDEGRRLMDEGKYDEACPKLEEGMRTLPGIGMKYNLAECYERAGRLASAWAAFLDAASMARVAAQADRERVCRRRASALEPELSRIVIIVTPQVDVPGLEVRRDGAPIGRGQWATGIPVDPGVHTVSATATGRRPWEHSVTLGSDSAIARVEVPLLPIDPTAKVTAPPMPWVAIGGDAERLTRMGKTIRVAGVTSMLVGAAGIGLGAAFGILTLNRVGDSLNYCGPGAYCYDVRGYADRNDAMTFGNVSTAGFVIGGVLAALGFGLYVFAPTEKVSATWHAGGHGFSVRF